MGEKGYTRGTQQCYVKIKEFRQAYQKAREMNNLSGAEPHTCWFYNKLHMILGGDPTSTPTSNMDTLQVCESRDNKEDDMVDEEEEENGRQLSDDFLEVLEALDSVASDNKDKPGPSCFCSTPVQIVDEDAKNDSYMDFRRRLGMELTEPVPCHERKKVMRSIVHVAVYGVLNHCLSEKLFEDCEGCVIDAPAQRHHDSVSWTSEDISYKLLDCVLTCV
ncbi:hypothetical protein UY3_18211 [Chelonia mydas]|uniref:Zinc finger and SCAN domain-containing protein 29 n=1 Tax=Chelonia mydas TaxID=8469 RepID=M7B958_CHEMY|nr:hypothetical protein UY3_18211 [Chelonia mydas]